jgi:hypothetical protein
LLAFVIHPGAAQTNPVADLARLRAATRPFQTLDSAVAAGYVRNVPACLVHEHHGAMGYHHSNAGYVDARLEVERPEILLYERVADGRYRLNGVEYIVPYRAWPRDSAAPVLFGRTLKREDNLAIWYLHVWAWTDNPEGLFADFHPEVRCGSDASRIFRPYTTPAASALRDSLRQADQALSAAAFERGLAAALTPALAGNAVLLLEDAPLLGPPARLPAARLSWHPFRVFVSADGSMGVTFGASVVPRPAGPPAAGRYITVWRRVGDAWRVAAHLHNGLADRSAPLPNGPALPDGNPQDPYADADRAFARLAADSGAPVAFARYVAPDGMTLAPTGELNIGPETVRARLEEGRAARAAWSWRPVWSLGSPDGDLGATIGMAEIRLPDGQVFYSKYLSVWQRQPDGALRFVIDAGSARPPG